MNKEETGIIIKNLETLIDKANKDYDWNIQLLLRLLDQLRVVAKD
jgi:hypothetical protein